jgi:Kelch motif
MVMLLVSGKVHVAAGRWYCCYLLARMWLHYEPHCDSWTPDSINPAYCRAVKLMYCCLLILFCEGLYGHSAVFHEAGNAIYIFGGYEYFVNSLAVSKSLYVLDLSDVMNHYNSSWNILPSNNGIQVIVCLMKTAMVSFVGYTIKL